MTTFFIVLLSGCAINSNNHESYTDFKPLEVSVHLSDTINEGGNQKVFAFVSQDNQDISNAELVRFEVWSNNHNQHEWITATSEGDGVYSADVHFTEEGLYFAKALTQVGDLYAMPTKRFAVGKLTPEEARVLIEGSKQTYSSDHSHH